MTIRQFQRAKIADVAKALGLSVSTVSRALNGYPDVSSKTRRRIEEQARRMNYQASSLGVKLRKGRGHAAGFVLPPTGFEFADPVFLAALAGIDERLRQANIQLIITTSASGEDQLPTLRRLVESDQIDAVILARLRVDDPRVAYLRKRNIPMSLLGRASSGQPVPSLELNHAAGVELAVERLVRLGRRRIAHLNAPLHYNYGLDRAAAFKTTIARHDLPPADQIELRGSLNEHSGTAMTTELLARDNPPDAILTANDAMAIGALHAITRRGLQPGRDISLIGFDDIPTAALMNPPLTTLHIPFHAIGVRLAEHLLQALDDDAGEPPFYMQDPTLIVRGT